MSPGPTTYDVGDLLRKLATEGKKKESSQGQCPVCDRQMFETEYHILQCENCEYQDRSNFK